MRATPIEAALLIIAALVSAWIEWIGWQDVRNPLDPCLLAGIAAILVSVLLLFANTMNARRLLALFLAAMPLVYLTRGFTAGNMNGQWTVIELVGLLIYGVIAWLGFRIQPRLLAAGILLHGVAWDSWHYRHSVYMPDWYAVGCLLVDICFAAYAAIKFSRR